VDQAGKQQNFTDEERRGVYRAIHERRDIRHFVPGKVNPDVLAQIIKAAHHAPSVGYMQPWRFIHMTNPSYRQLLIDLVNEERQKTAEALGERGEMFMDMKVEGIRECSDVIIVTLPHERDGYIFGRRSMPQMDLASASCAIQNMWLAARAEGIGMGWVSIFDPEALRRLLAAPEGVEPIAILCIGYVDCFDDRPLLEVQGWDERRPLTNIMMENKWQNE